MVLSSIVNDAYHSLDLELMGRYVFVDKSVVVSIPEKAWRLSCGVRGGGILLVG